MGNKSRLKPVSWRGRLFRDPQGGVTFPPAFVSDVRGYGYDRIGSNNPKYRVLIKSGKNATGSMSVTVLNSESEDQVAELYRRGSADPSSPEYSKVYRSGMTGVHLSLNLPVPIGSHYSSASFGNACAEARRIAHKRLTQRRRQFQGSVAVWELKKTLQMVKSPAKELRRQVAVASRRIPRVMKLLKRSRASRSTKVKALADTYLEVTFGWQPLLSDTRDGALALARLATRDALERQQFRAYGKTETPNSISFGNNYQVGYDLNSVLVYDREWRQKTVEECIIYGRFQVRLEDSSYCKATSLRLAELCGFSFADALPSAWEAMPWSFLVDYFTNVGDVLEAFANCVGDIAWASEVHIQTSQEDFLARFNESSTRAYHGGLYLASSSNSLHAISSRKSVVRVPTGVDLSTYLRFSLPQGLQWLNIGALVAGARPPKPFY